ncbi:sensor histidine kinase [Microbacterium sp. LRZ72]|uniref:sensor histidine kinase n=1 Tax=Microbacterium sp. LRZ72 TaxID=2942481 RepID=UPI0029A936D8|nr:sensor histidine kinase [Microbacterium sp. LRZ72]MDX2377947.1 sensor histidine kinase [Microbacterium sp. LRZ72]
MSDTRSTTGRPAPSARDLRHDSLLALALLLGAILSAGLTSVAEMYGDEQADLGWALLYAAALTLPLALRRRYPVSVATVVSVLYFVAVTFRIPEVYVGNIAVFIAIFTVGAWVDDRRRAMLARVLLIAGMFVWLLVTTFQAATAPTDDGFSRAGVFSPFVAYMLIQFLVNALFFGGAYYMGDRAYAAALQRRALEERTAELEREREVTAAQAVALDRVRIARELHDVVAHHVSAMGVQAGAARAVLAHDPDAAGRGLAGIEESARAAIRELRQLLATLRPGDDGAAGAADDESADAAASTVRLDGLTALAARATDTGLPTTVAVIGEPAAVPDVVQLNLYRIAQEALTNVRKHAGPSATADIRLRYTADTVELEITNTGRVPPPVGDGVGLIGMRERAGASGGTLEVGPRSRGGYLVRVSVPLAAAEATA